MSSALILQVRKSDSMRLSVLFKFTQSELKVQLPVHIDPFPKAPAFNCNAPSNRA